MIEIFSAIAVLGTLFYIVEKIGKGPFLMVSVLCAIIGIISYSYYGVNNFAGIICFLSVISFFLGGGKIPKL
ncbi:MAG: hypothetical protein WC850_06455 [Candidatus Gracilibacteria bacterium]